MAYFSSIWKARIIERCRQEYENEKINSILTSKTEIPRKTIMQKWRFYGHNTKRRFKGRLRKFFPDGSSVSNLYFYLKSDHAFPSLFMKSAIGFVGGIALTYLCFIFFVYQLSISYPHATVMSSIIGVLLTLGLAFSSRIRCLVFLLIPQMFSRVGRYTLTGYALVLILTGPATNTLRNSEVLTESMACSQEQIKISVRQISDSVKKPFNTIKRPIKLIMDRIKRTTCGMNRIVSRMSAIVTDIGDFIQSSFTWLNKIAEICTKKFGTPHDRCLTAMLQGVSNCKQRLGNIPRLYNESHVAESVCRHVGYDTVCVVADYATASFSATLKRKLRNFIARIKKTLTIEIDIHHTHIFSNNNTYTSPIAAGLVTDIRKKADPLLKWLSWSSCVTSLFLLLIIFRAKYYQHMFETRSRFDNRYVTKELRELDLKRFRERRETVLPLNKREQAKYICTTSFNLVASEKIYLTRSMVFMVITTFKLLIHIVADYSLYWVLITIRYQGNMKTPESDRSNIGIQVTPSSTIADFIGSLIESIILPLLPKTSSPTSCLPNPHPPDLQRYMHIGILIILLWFCALFEPYGLRLRHVIMGHYQPDRAKARALWLFNHILRTRGSFMELARRKLHREHKYSDQEHLTFRYWINSLVPCSCLKRVFGSSKTKHCLLCNTLEELTDTDTKLTSCETLKCPGVYCVRCFTDIGRLCTICLSPAEYGDVSDVSLEKGSSDSGTDDEDDNKHDSFIMREQQESEKESLINKKNLRKDKNHQGSSHSNDSGQKRESSLSLLNHHEVNENCNRPLVNLSYGSINDIDGDTKHGDKCGFKEIQKNIRKNVFNVQYELPNGGKLPKIDKNLKNNMELNNNKDEIRGKISNIGKFLVRKKVKMKHQKRMSHNLAFKGLFKLLYRRILHLKRHSKISRKKYIKVSPVQEKKRVRTRSQIKLFFAKKPKISYKQLKPINKCLIGKTLSTNCNNINNVNNNNNKRKYIKKRLTRAKYMNAKGYKINKISKFYKLCYCGNVPIKANLKRGKKPGNKKYLSTEENLITQYKNAKKLPKLRSERQDMEYQNNLNTDSYSQFRDNSELRILRKLPNNSKEKSYRTFSKIENKPVRTPLPFMKEIRIWLKSVLSIRRYDRKRKKQKKTAEKGAMALPLQKSRSCQYIAECVDLSYDTNEKDYTHVKPLFKQFKELDQKSNYETSSEKISSSKFSLSNTKTSTTVCSWCIIEYIKRKTKYKNVASNSKKGTNKDKVTDRSKLYDISTSTKDWWSPLEERRVIRSSSKGDNRKK